MALGFIAAVPFLPDGCSLNGYFKRMWSIKEYGQDGSDQGRFNAYRTGWKVFSERPVVGGGFQN